MGRAFVGALGAVWLAACGSSSSGGGGGTATTTPVSQQEFPMQVVSAICDNIAPCCMTAGLAYDANGCKQGVAVDAAKQYTKNASLDGVSWDANAAGACVALLRQAVGACMASAELLTQIQMACDGVVVGTKPPGAPCTSSAQCASPAGSKAICPSTSFGGPPGTGGPPDMPPQAVCTVETPPAHAKAGDPCNSTCSGAPSSGGSSDSCSGSTSVPPMMGGQPAPTGTCYASDGVACDFASSTCKPLLGPGDSCFDSLSCGGGTVCSGDKCIMKAQAGAHCDGSPGGCASGLYCDGTLLCAPQKSAGQPCASSGFEECADGFCSKGTCRAKGQLASAAVCSGMPSSSAGGGPKGGGGGAAPGP